MLRSECYSWEVLEGAVVFPADASLHVNQQSQPTRWKFTQYSPVQKTHPPPLNGQNHSPNSHHPIKNPPARFPIPLPLSAIWKTLIYQASKKQVNNVLLWNLGESQDSVRLSNWFFKIFYSYPPYYVRLEQTKFGFKSLSALSNYNWITLGLIVIKFEGKFQAGHFKYLEVTLFRPGQISNYECFFNLGELYVWQNLS